MANLEIRIHDEPFKKSVKNVTALNICVKQINIVNANGEVLPCSIKEEKRLNILEIAKSNPVVLSSVSVPYGEFLYCSWYRNIDNDTNFKWQKFIDLGYGGGTENNNLIGNFIGGLYRESDYYRPTYNGTMNKANSSNPQFGPVNTYHLVASLKIRTSSVDLKINDSLLGILSNKTEWSHYSIAQFVEEWPPEMFNNKQ